jgi:hypothetical protein
VPSQPPAAESSIQRRIDQLLSAFSPSSAKEAPSPVQAPPSKPKPSEDGAIEITDIQEAPVHMAKPAPNIDAASVDHVAPSVTPRAVESLDDRLERLRPALSAQTGSVSFSWQPLNYTIGQVALKGLRELHHADAPSVPQKGEEGATTAAEISPGPGCAEVAEEMETVVVVASVEPEAREAGQLIHAEDVSEAIEAADLDLGYLALYQDELPFHFTRRPAAAHEGRGHEQFHTAESHKETQPEPGPRREPVESQDQELAAAASPAASEEPITEAVGSLQAAIADSSEQGAAEEEGAEELVQDAVELPPSLEGIEPDEDPHETFASDKTLEPVADCLSEETSEAEEDVLSAVPSAEIIPLFRPEPPPVQAWSYQFPEIGFLAEPPEPDGTILTEDVLEEAAGRLETVIRDERGLGPGRRDPQPECHWHRAAEPTPGDGLPAGDPRIRGVQDVPAQDASVPW